MPQWLLGAYRRAVVLGGVGRGGLPCSIEQAVLGWWTLLAGAPGAVFRGFISHSGLTRLRLAVVGFGIASVRGLSLWTPLVAVGHRQRSLRACGRQGKQDKSLRTRMT